MENIENAKISIIMPVYNERHYIEEIIKRIFSVPLEKQVIIVDDGSTDGTREILTKLKKNIDIKVIFHEKNKGKGAALRTGIGHRDGDIIIFQDSDLEYDPNEYFELIRPIISGNADVVYGSRLSGGKPHRAYMFWHKLGNNFLNLVTNILFNATLTDMETGYKVFRREVFEKVKIRSSGFTVEPEITAKVFKNKFRVYEVPISYYGRTYREGKKITWKHGFEALFALFWFKFFD